MGVNHFQYTIPNVADSASRRLSDIVVNMQIGSPRLISIGPTSSIPDKVFRSPSKSYDVLSTSWLVIWLWRGAWLQHHHPISSPIFLFLIHLLSIQRWDVDYRWFIEKIKFWSMQTALYFIFILFYKAYLDVNDLQFGSNIVVIP